MGKTPQGQYQAQQPYTLADSKRQSVWILIIILTIAAFALFAIPNANASDNLAMVQVFEPDESALFPVIANMAKPKGDLVTFVKQFIVYERYNYISIRCRILFFYYYVVISNNMRFYHRGTLHPQTKVIR